MIVPADYPVSSLRGKTVIAVDGNAFKDKTFITSVTAGDTLAHIYDSAFEGCTSLETVTIGSGLDSIGTVAFKDCTALESFTSSLLQDITFSHNTDDPEHPQQSFDIGATHTVNRKETSDIVGDIKAITDGGVNYAIDTSGVPDFVKKALASCRFMGTAVVLGATGDVTFNIQQELMGDAKSLIGIIEGDAIPKLFIPKLLDYYRKGMFPFDKLIKFYPFEEINTAFKESHEGKCIKAVLEM